MLANDASNLTSDPQLPQTARVLGNMRLAGGVHLIQVAVDEDGVHQRIPHRPGQFVMVSAIGVGEAPFFIACSPTRWRPLELIVVRMGPVTNALCDARENTLVGLRGPLGNGYPIEAMAGYDLLILTQNYGISAARALLWYALDRRRDFGKVSFIYEVPEPSGLILERELEIWTARRDLTAVVTSASGEAPGWQYDRGPAGARLSHLEVVPKNTFAVLCGTPDFYRDNCRLLVSMGFSKDRMLVSLARRMRCGVGKCGHCRVGSKTLCLDGPVFTYWDAINLPEVM